MDFKKQKLINTTKTLKIIKTFSKIEMENIKINIDKIYNSILMIWNNIGDVTILKYFLATHKNNIFVENKKFLSDIFFLFSYLNKCFKNILYPKSAS